MTYHGKGWDGYSGDSKNKNKRMTSGTYNNSLVLEE